eukprot:s2676_g5.t1
MIPRQLSNCLWAAAQLEDLEPSVLKMVPAIVERIASTAGKTNLQDVANNLDALVNLQGSVAEIGPLLAPGQTDSFLRRAADRLNGGSGLNDHPLFASVAERFMSSAQPSKLPDWDLCALAWAYQVGASRWGRAAAHQNYKPSQQPGHSTLLARLQAVSLPAMASSDGTGQAKHPARSGHSSRSRCLAAILMASLATSCAMTAFGVVVGDQLARSGRVTRPPSARGRRLSGADEAKKLTARMKEVNSAAGLINILDGVVDGPIFNKFHASAAYHSLATWKRRRRLQLADRESVVLPRLHGRVRSMISRKKLGPREGANVFWATAHLSGAVPNITRLVPALVKVLPEQMETMNPQELSNSLWAVAQLQEVEPLVLQMVPALVQQIPSRANDMIPQHLSNCLWAAAQLQEKAPDVLKIVPLLVDQILVKVKDMMPQHLSNCLWAAVQLREAEPAVLKMVPAISEEVPGSADAMIPQALSSLLLAAAQLHSVEPQVLRLVPSVLAQLPIMAERMVPQVLSNCLSALIFLQDPLPELVKPALLAPDGRRGFVLMAANRLKEMLPSMTSTADLHIAVPTVVWACARLGVQHDLLLAVAQHLGSKTKVSGLPDWGLCALAWSFQALEPEEFLDFEELLLTEINKRGFTDEQVERSQLGSWEWHQSEELEEPEELETGE